MSLQQCSRAIDLPPAGSLPAAEPQLLPPYPPPESHKLIIRKTPRIIKVLLFTPRTFTVVTLSRSNIRRSLHNLLCTFQVRQPTTNTDVATCRVALHFSFCPKCRFLFHFLLSYFMRKEIYEPVGTGGSLPGVKLTTHLQLLTRSRIRGSIHLLPLTSSWGNA
jgi:hypothetical protein